MVQKRPFGDEESYEASSKHRRQLDYSTQLVSSLEFVCAEDAAQQPNISGKGKVSVTEGYEKHAGSFVTELPLCTENNNETRGPGCISRTSFVSCGTSQEEDGSEAPFHLLFPPNCYNAHQPIRTLVRSEEIYSSLLESPPHKLVPIGPDFQAVIPEYDSQGAKKASDGSDASESEPSTLSPRALESESSDRNDVECKLARNCVIPLPEFGPSIYNDEKVGDGGTDCSCEDSGSVRCVRQHIKEAREKLWKTLGHDIFSELGFFDMGEVVADKWSQEEELIFREVVFSNPALSGTNFWDHLSVVFPSHAKKDIVSYYFNVFMLQRRALQNRCDPMNVDSDDDVWQGTDDSDEDEDSVVESPVRHDDSCHDDLLEDDSHECDDGVPCGDFSNYESDVVGCDEGTGNLVSDCGPRPHPMLHLPGEPFWDENGDHGLSQYEKKGDHDVPDDSCTSSDDGTARQMKANSSECHSGCFKSMNGGDGNELVLEHCDAKVWDVGYLTCPKNDVEFLPTCSVIEEVFGVGAWNYMASDGKGLS